MNQEEIYYLGQNVAVVAIVGSLLFVAYQIMIARNQLKGSATIAVFTYLTALCDQLSEDTQLYKIALRGNEDINSLDEWEKHRFTIWALKETGMWEMCWHLRRQRALDRQLFEGKEEYWLTLHSAPGRREWWEHHTLMLGPDFRAYVSDKLKVIPVRPLRDANLIFDPLKFAPDPKSVDGKGRKTGAKAS